MRGMEMMLSSMMKSLGIDPVVVMNAIQQMADGVTAMRQDMAEVKQRLTELEALQRGEVLSQISAAETIEGSHVNGKSG